MNNPILYAWIFAQVTPDFHILFSESKALRKLERKVESEYADRLSQRCDSDQELKKKSVRKIFFHSVYHQMPVSPNPY